MYLQQERWNSTLLHILCPSGVEVQHKLSQGCVATFTPQDSHCTSAAGSVLVNHMEMKGLGQFFSYLVIQGGFFVHFMSLYGFLNHSLPV